MRAKATPSLVNLEDDPRLQELKQGYERALIASRLKFDKQMKILDLGAGYGQWAFYFSPYVKSVMAVEQSEAMIELGLMEAKKLQITNVVFAHSDAVLFQPTQSFDLVFISGLIMYLNDPQTMKLAEMAIAATKPGGRIFLREMGSILEDTYSFEDRWSDKLQSFYSAIYRTDSQFEKIFAGAGQMRLLECGDVYPDNSPLNSHVETRLRYYIFEKPQDEAK